MKSHVSETDQRISTWKLWHFWAPAIPFVKNCAWRMDNVAQIVAESGSHRKPNQCLILHDVAARTHEEAEEIEVWSPSYPRSLRTVWIGNNEQSVGQIRIHYSKRIAEILSSTQRAPWTRARMCTIQGHEAFENSQGHGGRHCPPLPQAMSIKNKGVLRVGVPSMQDLQEWAEHSQSFEDYKQFLLVIFRRLQAIDAWNVWGSTAVAGRKKSKRQMEATISIKWCGTQKLNLFASTADKCEPHRNIFFIHFNIYYDLYLYTFMLILSCIHSWQHDRKILSESKSSWNRNMNDIEIEQTTRKCQPDIL